MTLVFEVPLQPDHVLLVFLVGLCQFLQDLDLFHPGFLPISWSVSYRKIPIYHGRLHSVITPNDFDCHKSLSTRVHCSYNTRKHALA